MGFLKFKQPVLESGRAVAPAQSLTSASTGTLVSGYGVTVISSSAAKTYRLTAPVRAGQVKEILMRASVGANKITVLAGASTAATFFNSTKGAVLTSTAQNAQPSPVIRLISVSTGTSYKWAVLGKSTGCTLTA